MLFKKFHISIIREENGSCKSFRSRGWALVFSVLFVAGLAASSSWLFYEYHKLSHIKARLAESEAKLEEQQNQLLALVDKFSSVRTDLNRIQSFDTKLRVMMNIDGELSQVGNAQGGPEAEPLNSARLPLHRQDLMLKKLNAYLKQLATETRLEEIKQQQLLLTMRHTNELIASVPSSWPVEGFLTSRFGKRPSPFTGQTIFHKGIDIGARSGTPVLSTAKGKVILARYDGAYGNSVVIDHGAGMTTRYAHMKKLSVREGQAISRGDQIGTVGSTGRSSGPHLHYEVRLNNVPVDPMRYIDS